MSNKLVFTIHAIQRMAQRAMSINDVRQVIDTGIIVEDYPNDSPYPSRLILGWIEQRPIHVVASDNSSALETIVITVYEPDPQQWLQGFTRRKS